MSPDSPQPPPRPPHPLALELIARLRSRPGATVIEIGRGSGRNTQALESAGFRVCDVDAAEYAAAALSTHALLHGTPQSIGALLSDIADKLEPGAPLFVTFGSIHDARFGKGAQIAERVFAPSDGDEQGVLHTYFDEGGVRELLNDRWSLESLREVNVDEVAGRWAHVERPLQNAVHWFAIAAKR